MWSDAVWWWINAWSEIVALLASLDEAHRVGILHRDLKPTNVLFREDGSLALIDFGLAKQAHLQAELTGTGEIFGTPYYMSPEQGHGEPLDEPDGLQMVGVYAHPVVAQMVDREFEIERPPEEPIREAMRSRVLAEGRVESRVDPEVPVALALDRTGCA